MRRRLAGRDRSRISDEATSSGLIENSSTRSGRDSCESTASTAARSVPGRVATPSRASSSTRSGSFQVRNAANSSAPMRNSGSSSPSARASRRYGRTGRARRLPRRAARTQALRAGGGSPPPCRRPCGRGPRRRGREAGRAGNAAPRPRPVRRGRHAADRTPRPESRQRSFPVEDLVADLDLGALAHPGRPQCLLELLPFRRCADDAKAALCTQHLEPPALRRLRPVLQEIRQLGAGRNRRAPRRARRGRA